MAQNTAGISLSYGTYTKSEDTITAPTTWTQIPDVKSIPAMGVAPSALDSTDLSETVMKTYVSGLSDLGGSLEFTCNMTTELVTAVADAAAIDLCAFKITYPAPLNKSYWWCGAAAPVLPGEAAVDAILETSLFISQETAVAEVPAGV